MCVKRVCGMLAVAPVTEDLIPRRTLRACGNGLVHGRCDCLCDSVASQTGRVVVDGAEVARMAWPSVVHLQQIAHGDPDGLELARRSRVDPDGPRDVLHTDAPRIAKEIMFELARRDRSPRHPPQLSRRWPDSVLCQSARGSTTRLSSPCSARPQPPRKPAGERMAEFAYLSARPTTPWSVTSLPRRCRHSSEPHF